jgi:hypothetical protein
MCKALARLPLWQSLLPWLLTALAAVNVARAEEAVVAERLDRMATAAAIATDARVASVLPRIEGVGPRLLALRSYLRSGDRLAERWSWSQEQIAAYAGSPEQQELDAEIGRVRQEFEKANPGYTLFVNPQVRSLDIQLANWGRNESVAAAAARLLLDAITHFLGRPVDDAAGAAELAAFLHGYVPEPIPTVAAPGLSPHGQMRASDFQVHRGDEIVAGPDTRTVDTTWMQEGWGGRLDAAVRAASRRFVGPLASPREPWHYTYTPVAVADR